MHAKKRLNPLPPTLREKKRYILFKVFSDKMFSKEEVEQAIKAKTLELFGAFGLAEMNPKLAFWNSENSFGILRCERSNKEKAIVALTFVKEITGSKAAIETLATSGTIKTLKEKLKEVLR